jgi:hypothetical protein
MVKMHLLRPRSCSNAAMHASSRTRTASTTAHLPSVCCPPQDRIQRAGGQVINNRGARVQGVLAMSRAIGDHALRPYVVADPEVAWVARRPGDNLLLLASDGLWDVMSSQVGCWGCCWVWCSGQA